MIQIENPKLVYWSSDRRKIADIFSLLKSAGLPVKVEGGEQRSNFAQLRKRVAPLLSKLLTPLVWLFSFGDGQISLFTDRSVVERARELIKAYKLDPASAMWEHQAQVSTIPVRCEDCGKQAEFPQFQLGTIQHCPHCDAHIDCGNADR